MERLLTVMEGLRAGKKPRGIAEDIWKKEDVAAVWNSDSWMRSQIRRWIPKAQALAAGGWREGDGAVVNGGKQHPGNVRGGCRMNGSEPVRRVAGRSLREIAVDRFGAERVAAEWHPDGWMRARVRRLVDRARAAGSEPPPGPASG